MLDVGFGTAIWCYDIAAQHPSFDVVGIDLVSEQPVRQQELPNVRLITPVDFTRPDWPFLEGDFDFIRNAGLSGSVPNWHDHFRKCYR